MLDIEKIKEILPQRFPFLMIDRVTEIDPGKKVVAIKNVTANEQFFLGHFPNIKVMPGALILEAMAQAAIIFFYFVKNPKKDAIYYLGKVEAKFMHPVVPGDQLRIEVAPVKVLSNLGIVNTQAFVAEKSVAKAQISFSVK